MKTLIAILTVVLLTGCATTDWCADENTGQPRPCAAISAGDRA